MSKITHVMSVDLVPADAMAAQKLRTALDEMCAEDPTLGVTIGPVDEILLQGVTELHMEIAVDILKRGRGLDFQVGAPQVHYRECITKPIEWDYTHKRQTGGWSEYANEYAKVGVHFEPTSGRGEYAKVKIRFEPGEPGSGFAFESAVRGGAVPEAFIPAIEKGLRTAAEEPGVIAGFPVIDIRCALIDGGYHETDSTERIFEIAARACFREALPKAGPRLLEPIMEVGVVTPQKYLGDVVGDLNSRHGQVTGMDELAGKQVIIAFVPVANLFGYIYTLKHMTRGGATCTMAFSHYEQVPPARGPDDDNFPPAIGMRA
jgi:elongation factor G